MKNEHQEYPNFVIAGRLQRVTLLPAQGPPLIDQPGGNLIHAASGLGVWSRAETSSSNTRTSSGSGRAHRPLRAAKMVKGGLNAGQGEPQPGELIGLPTRDRVGLLARVGEDYPHAWLHSFEQHGWDTRGIHILAEALDLRYFQATLPHAGSGTTQDNQLIQRSNPLAHFARLGLPFPKALLGYQPPIERGNDRKSVHPASPRPNDIPADYLYARAAHICPLDYLTASRLSSTFRQAMLTTVTIDPSASYMTSKEMEQLRILLQGVTAFLPAEEELRALFWGLTDDLWQMAEALGGFGCEFIVVKRGARGQMLYDSAAKKRWEIPAYPARAMDLTGAGDSFCGGFLAGYQKSYDPLRGVLFGSVSASLTIEGCSAFHALEALPGLAEARLASLTGLVRQV